MSSNNKKATKFDVADVYKLQYRIMRIMASWPESNPTIWYRIRTVAHFLVLVVFGVTMMLEAYNDLHNLARMTEILYVLITVIINVVKLANIFVKRKLLRETVRMLTDPIFSSYPDDLNYLMTDRIKSVQLLAKTFLVSVHSCCTLMGLSPFFSKAPLPFPFPYELGKFRPVMHVYQTLGAFVVGSNNVYLDTIPAGFIGVAATQLEILSEKIIRLRNRNRKSLFVGKGNEKETLKDLKQCVEHHLAIITYVGFVYSLLQNLIEQIDRMFSFSTFSQFLASGMIICNTVFHFVLVPVGSSQFFVLINYLIIVLIQIFMYCWYGNEVILKSVNVRQACYFSSWYNSGNETRKHLFIIMERSKRPLKVTAFKVSNLSLSSFTSIMRWTYSYFTLLMNMYRKQT